MVIKSQDLCQAPWSASPSEYDPCNGNRDFDGQNESGTHFYISIFYSPIQNNIGPNSGVCVGNCERAIKRQMYQSTASNRGESRTCHSRGGWENPSERGANPTYFLQFLEKNHEIKEILVSRLGGAPLDPPLNNINNLCIHLCIHHTIFQLKFTYNKRKQLGDLHGLLRTN